QREAGEHRCAQAVYRDGTPARRGLVPRHALRPADGGHRRRLRRCAPRRHRQSRALHPVIARLAGIILPVFLVVALGYAWGRRARPDMQAVNRLSMNLLGPALIFSALASKDFDVHANGVLMIAAVGVVLGSGLIAWPVARALGVDYRTFLPPMMFNNCGNVGLPLAVLAFGAAGFSSMVALFTISNLLHFTVGVWMIDHHARIGKLLRTPMVLATFAGFACALLKPPLPDWLTVAIRMVGDALVPVMLISLGVRLTSLARGDWHLGAI